MDNVRKLQLPPHSVEAEQALLGSLLIDRTVYARISKIVCAADFYRGEHRAIYAAIVALVNEGVSVDAVTVSEHLDRRGRDDCGGLAYIGTLAKDTPCAAHAEDYARTVNDHATMRRLKEVGDSIVRMASSREASAAEVVAEAQDRLLHLHSAARAGRGLVSSTEILRELLDQMDAHASGGVKRLRLGLTDLDDLTGGLEPGDLKVLGARPSVGKSAVMVTIATNVGYTTEVAIFSAEMPRTQLMRRCLALRSGVNQKTLRDAEKLNDAQWTAIAQAQSAMADLRVRIDDTPQPTLTHIRAECLAQKAQRGLGLVIVDYLQLVRGDGKSRYEELRTVSYGLKALAKELQVPVIALAQLNRDLEKRDQKRPVMADIRDSGAIEEAADVVGLLYSEAQHNPDFQMPYVLECAIAKNRNGERGLCHWRFDASTSHITVLDEGARLHYARLLNPGPPRKGPKVEF